MVWRVSFLIPKFRHCLRMKKRFVQAALDLNQNVSDGSSFDSLESLMEKKELKPRGAHHRTFPELKRVRKGTLKK